MTQRKLCAGCNSVKHISRFAKAHPDFPTRDGRAYCCRACNVGKPRYKVVPSNGQFRKLERVEPSEKEETE